MTPSQLEFNLAVREWVNEASHALVPSGTDEKLIVKYADLTKNKSLTDDQHEELRRTISSDIKAMAYKHDAEIDLEFTDLGYGELGVIIYLKDPPGREEAKAEYYDLLYNSSRLSKDQFARMQVLVKKYGFK